MRRAGKLSTLLVLAALLVPAAALAGDKDTDGLVAVAEALAANGEGKHAQAKKSLGDALAACSGAACAAGTRAQLYVALGIVEGAGLKNAKSATAAFESALREDPKVVPDPQFMTPMLKKLFADAQKNVKKAGGSASGKGPSKAQLDQMSLAEKQLSQKDWSSCMGTIIEAMAEKEFAAGKYTLALCEDAGGLMLEATADAKVAVKLAEDEGNGDVGRKATELVARLEKETPAITVVMPKTVDEAVLTVDGVVVPKEKADKPILHNPGKATIEVKGKKGGFPFEFKSTESFERGEQIKVNADDGGAGKNYSAVQACLASARSAVDLNRCIESGGKGRGLSFRGGLEVASYNDTTQVDVFTPTLFFAAENPTAGWSVAGNYTVDVVSNASPDIVATASRRFDEVRLAGALGAEVKVGPARVAVDGSISVEPDYVGRSVGGAISADLYNKQITPTLAYHAGVDILGRAHTPFNVFSRNITNHSIDASVSAVLSPTSMMVFAGTAAFQLGDTSKPYRHIPMFSSGVAAALPRGATPSLVDSERLSPMPLEQVPDTRDRFAFLVRFAHRFDAATLRADERLYLDTWGLKASTTDFRYIIDATKTLRVGPHARFHVQGGVDFWERAYVATPTAQGWTLPKFRTLDREFSPLLTGTLGGQVRWAITDIFAVALVAEGSYTQFLDTIYVFDRWGLFTGTTLELGIE